MNNILGIIPARYASSRFPGKPLVMIGNKSMIQRVYEQSSLALSNVVVATDDIRILELVKSFGGKVVMTSDKHKSGTDRCFEAAKNFKIQNPEIFFDVIINIQGDEPFINPKQILDLANCFENKTTQIATLIKFENDIKVLKNPNIVKVVIKNNYDAIYFSRALIPFIRDYDIDKWTEKQDFYKHIGIYAYRYDILQKITELAMSNLEIAESLEQNRWIQNGFSIKTKITHLENKGIDTPEDLLEIINSKNLELL